MQTNLYLLVARIETACASFCKAADCEDLLAELEETSAYYVNCAKEVSRHSREGKRARFVVEHLARYKGRLQDRIRELNRIEEGQAEHAAFLERRAKADYAMREEGRRRDWSQPQSYGKPSYARDA